MSFCRLVIQGNVGQKPEVRFTSSGDPIANFSIAVSEKRGKEETTTWFRCTAFKKVAEIAGEYLDRGSSAIVDGRIQCRKYTDKNGAERESWEVAVDRLQLLNNPKAAGKVEPKQTKQGNGFEDMPDDLPF